MTVAVREAAGSTLEHAIEYAAVRGWPVFPCFPADKRPCILGGFKSASTKPNALNSWWRQYQDAMIGVPTGKSFWVLDIDCKEGKDGFESLATLESANGTLPATLTCSTPSGGKHYYFAPTDAVRNSASGLAQGIDVRGEGGYVIVPGSVREDGLCYEWDDATIEIAAAPEWLIALLLKPKAATLLPLGTPARTSNKPYVAAAVVAEIDKLKSITSGRNTQLNNSAIALGSLVGDDLSAGEATDLLYGAAVANGYVAKDGASTARKTINSGLTAGMASPRTIPQPSTSNQWLPPADTEWWPANDNVKPPKLVVPKMHPTPFLPSSAGGLLATITEWITENAIIPVPELSLAASLALMGGLFGERALGPTRSGVNLFMVTVMGVATGKGHAPKAIIKLANLVGKPGAVSNGDPTSYSAIERMVRKNNSTAMVMDEFGITLQDVNGKSNSAASSIRKFLLSIYDQADSVFHGKQYASEASKIDNEPINGPALTVLGMTTGHALYKGLTEDSLSEGFISRFIFVEGTSPTVFKAPSLERVESSPTALVGEIQKALTDFPRAPGNYAGLFKKHVVKMMGGEPGDAYKRYAQVFEWEHWAGWSPRQRDTNGRASENTIRLATVRAISRCPSAPLITAEDIEWGWAIVHRSIQVATDGADHHMSGSAPEAMRKAILEALRQAKGHCLPWSQVLQREGVTKGSIKEVSEAMTWLIQAGDVATTHEGAKPGPRQSFTLKSCP